MKHIIDPLDLSVEEIDSFMDLADKILADPAAYAHCLQREKTRYPVL